MTAQYNSLTAYLWGYQSALTNKPKPSSQRYQEDIDLGYNDGKSDLHKQMLGAYEMGTVQ